MLPPTPTGENALSKTYCPPPTWPAPPAGWTPPPGWQPDPAWGPAPEGWQLWSDDAQRRGWFRSHKILTAVAGLIALLVIVGALGSLSSDPISTTPAAGTEGSFSPSPQSAADKAAAAALLKAEEAGKASAEASQKAEADALAKEQAKAEAEAKVKAAADAKAKAAAEAKTQAAAAKVDEGVVPNVVGINHQLAQDTMQAAGYYNLSEEDATGANRMLIIDRNWVVVEQIPAAGTKANADTTIVLRSKKIGE
jgi:hypothetical protein